MKRIVKENRIKIIQFTFATMALGFYIIYSLLVNPVLTNSDHLIEWHISRIIYAVPYIVCLLSIVFGRHKNPRKLSALSISLILLSFIPSYLNLLIYPPLVLISNSLSYEFSTIIFSILFLCGFVLLLSLPDIRKSTYSVGLTVTAVISFSYAVSKIYIINGMPSLNLLAFSFLMFAIALFGINFDYKNQYEPKYYKLLGIDNNNYMNFDYIVDIITDSYLTDSSYSRAVEARTFYYAIKNDNKKELAELNITGKDDIRSIFALWLKFEKIFPSDKESVTFFNLCKYMISDKISDEDFDDKFFLFGRTVRTQKNMFGRIDINNKEKPANILSSLYDETFEYDDIIFTSAESFYQGLKFKDSKKQARIFAMTGKAAKKAGKHHNWWKLTNNLYFKGKKINRYSSDYDRLIVLPLAARYCHAGSSFKQALLDTEFKTLEYPSGKAEKYQTVLTEDEYLNGLNFFKRKAFDEYYLNENITEEL